ncbi:MAG: heme-binding protein, partial [Bacteroidota bacterium]|nr:heme-binding protein [Bacteroidota bacterium]
TPVYMSVDKKNMEFVLPRKYVKDSLSLPKGYEVESYFSNPTYVASIGYSGYSNSTSELRNTNILLQLLDKMEIKTKGIPYILVYNGPYKFFNRRNEIHVEIEYK